MLAISIDPIKPVKCITELLESLKKAVADKNEGAITSLSSELVAQGNLLDVSDSRFLREGAREECIARLH